MMKLDSELLSITVLMDDSDNSVREAVIERLIARGEEALSVLEQFVTENQLNILTHQQLISEVRERMAFNKFLNYLNSQDHPLIDGLVLLTKCVDPQWDERNFLFVVSEMSDDIIKEFSDDNTDFEKLNIFNYCFFKRFGFNISLTDASEEWREIDKVIEKRDGSSITVSIIYFLLARSVGVEIHPLCFSGGLIPVFTDEKGKLLFYLNLFKGGELLVTKNFDDILRDRGIDFNFNFVKIEEDLALVTIYAELLNLSLEGEKLKRIEKIVALFDGKRYLNP
ncbi:MAG: hypothetical protein KBG04_03980 [Bacteroidales bacterium]|nr:hypothetical protein [Bacteroidales bacterium]